MIGAIVITSGLFSLEGSCLGGRFPNINPPGPYIRRGLIYEAFLRFEFVGGGGGGYIWRGLYTEGIIFGILRS